MILEADSEPFFAGLIDCDVIAIQYQQFGLGFECALLEFAGSRERKFAR